MAGKRSPGTICRDCTVSPSIEWWCRRGGGSLRGARRGVVVGVDRFVMSHATFNQERKNDVQDSLSQVG